MKTLIIFLLLVILLGIISCDEEVVKPINHQPIIFSLTAFPDIIGPQDSSIIICNAMDPDADTLVYDWYTDGKSRIKGAPYYNDWVLYNTSENSCIVFPKNVNIIPIDTLWIECSARDGKGGGAVRSVSFILKYDSLDNQF